MKTESIVLEVLVEGDEATPYWMVLREKANEDLLAEYKLAYPNRQYRLVRVTTTREVIKEV